MGGERGWREGVRNGRKRKKAERGRQATVNLYMCLKALRCVIDGIS